MQFLGFGSGVNGDLNIAGNTTDAPTDSTVSGSASSNVLTVGSGLAFATNDWVFIHQTRGTGVGGWELAQVDTYSGTTLNVRTPLTNSYVNGSGADQAQVIVVKQYRSVTVALGFNLYPKYWNESVGGILVYAVSGPVVINGSINAQGRGYLGGLTQAFAAGSQGEGTSGTRQTVSQFANGSGGGGTGAITVNSGGGGGGHAASGTNGSGAQGGFGGADSGNSSLTSITFGGAGGSTGDPGGGGAGSPGGFGGGIVILFCQSISFGASGSINANGDDGTDAFAGNNGGSGGGAGGSVLIKSGSAIIGTNLITALGGSGGTKTGSGSDGGAGAVGRVRVEACVVDGDSNPAASISEGGNAWCSMGGYIY